MVGIFRYIDYNKKNSGYRGNGSNYGCHCMAVSLPDITIYFSYETPVAFTSHLCHEGKMVMRENEWGPTTGTHLNAIYTKASSAGVMTVSGEVFVNALDATLAQIFSKGKSKRVEIVEKLVEVEKIRKVVVPKVYKTVAVCPHCEARKAKMAKAEKHERNILL